MSVMTPRWIWTTCYLTRMQVVPASDENTGQRCPDFQFSQEKFAFLLYIGLCFGYNVMDYANLQEMREQTHEY